MSASVLGLLILGVPAAVFAGCIESAPMLEPGVTALPLGVRVSIVEPSIVGTAFVDNAVDSLRRAPQHSLWASALDHTMSRKDSFSAVQLQPAQVAAVVLRAANARRPSE